MSDIDAAAERWLKDAYDYDQPICRLQRELDARALADAYLARLAADKRREDERAKPVTMKEAVEAFATSDHIVCTEGKAILIEMDHVFIPIQTRGQLLDLLRSLGVQTNK